MLISIITVCYNCQSEIERTMQSVLDQSFHDYEYIIIDGASNDGTFQRVEEFQKRNPRMRGYSEPDKGIYDAMNKGLAKARGEYVFFLNAGDRFCDKEVLSSVAARMADGKDIYYGDVSKDGVVRPFIVRMPIFQLVYMERMICHQSMFAKRELFDDTNFDTSYRICADRDWLIRQVRSGRILAYMPDMVIAYYDTSGVSSFYDAYEKESIKITRRYGGAKAVAFVRLKRYIGSLLGRRYKHKEK